MMSQADRETLAVRLVTLQGLYYLLFGLWPFLNPDSFVGVVGRLPQPFLKFHHMPLMIGAGIVLLVEGLRRRTTIVGLAYLAAIAFAATEVFLNIRTGHTFWPHVVVQIALAINLHRVIVAGYFSL